MWTPWDQTTLEMALYDRPVAIARNFMPSLNSLAFETPGYELRGIESGVKLWYTSDDDGMGLYFFEKPPDLPTGASDLRAIRQFYESLLPGPPAGIVDCNVVVIDGISTLQTLIKVPQKPTGMMYVGSITIPFQEFSYVAKVQCPEIGLTGVREAILLDKMLKNNPDADPERLLKEAHAKGVFDSLEYDKVFPQHPVARARRALNDIRGGIKIGADVKAAARFTLPCPGK